MRHLILLDAGGFLGKIVTAHVGSNRAIVLAELGQLVLPLVPEFRKAVQEYDERPFPGADIVEPNAVHHGIFVFDPWHFFGQCAAGG